MERDEFTPGLRSTLFAALTGRGGDVTGRSTDVQSMLLAVGGASARTRSGVDTTAAARELGVAPRTVQRWLAGRARPATRNLRSLQTRSRQAASTQRGRRAALAGRRGDALAQRGARVEIRGEQGPRRHGADYMRHRRTTLSLDPDAVEQMRLAYAEGGDKGFVAFMESAYDANYADGWQFATIDTIDMGPSPYGVR